MKTNPLYLKVNNDQTIPVTIKEDGVGVNIAGWTLKFTVKPVLSDVTNDSDAVISVVTTSHVDPTNGVSSIAIPKEDIPLELEGAYVGDIRVLDDSGKEKNTQIFDVYISKISTNLVS